MRRNLATQLKTLTHECQRRSADGQQERSINAYMALQYYCNLTPTPATTTCVGERPNNPMTDQAKCFSPADTVTVLY
jgi:hypothetical protein